MPLVTNKFIVSCSTSQPEVVALGSSVVAVEGVEPYSTSQREVVVAAAAVAELAVLAAAGIVGVAIMATATEVSPCSI